MHHLATLPALLAQDVVDALHAIEIPAATTDTPLGAAGWLPGLSLGSLVVWVLEKRDLADAREVLEALKAEAAANEAGDTDADADDDADFDADADSDADADADGDAAADGEE